MRSYYFGPFIDVRSNAAKVAGIVMYAVLVHSMASKSRLRSSQPMVDGSALEGQPKAGDLVRHVKQQLGSDHHTLGKVSKTLVAVQTDVDKTEQSMLGKVLDLQTARSFFTRHEEINAANAKLKDDVSKLNTRVEDLSSTLYRVQKGFLTNSATNQKAEAKLRSEDITEKGLTQSMNAELAKATDMQKELMRLTKIHENFMDEAVKALRAGRKSVDMLKETRAASRQEVGKHRSLRHQLVASNNYSMACHANVKKTSNKMGRALLKESKGSKARIMTVKQRQKSNAASQQRLLAEHALLIAEVKKYENQEAGGVAKLKDLREDMQILEKRILQGVHSVKENLRYEEERVKSLRTSLMENAQAEDQDLSKQAVVDAHIKDLAKQVHYNENPVIMATTEGQNNALQAELSAAYTLWKQVKQTETSALLNRDQAQSDLTAQKAALAMVDHALAIAQREGRKRLEDAIETANKSKAKSGALIQKAQAAIAARCKSEWDDISNRKFAKLSKCKVWKDDLVMENARKQLLMQTAKAQLQST